MAPHHRSVDPERLHHLVTLPHGDSSVSPKFHPSRRLDDLPGPAGRIPSGSSASRFASLPSLRGSREVVPVQGPLFRSYNRAPSLHEDYGTSVRHPPQVRGQDASLPGRLAHPGLYRDRLHSVKGQAPVNLHRTWHPGQPHKVVSSSHSVTSVLRHGDSVSAFYCSSHTSTSQQSHSPDRGVLVDPVSSGVTLASSTRPPVIPDSSCLWRDDQNEASPTLPQGSMGLSGRPVCNLPDSEASSIFLSSLRSAGGGDGCSSPTLGQSPSLCLSSDRHHKESSSQTEVLEELRVDSHSSVLASEGLVPRSSGTIVRRSSHTVKSKRSSKTAPLPPIPSKSAYASADCMATIKRFALQAGFSPAVAGQLIFSRRLSTRLNYQARWGTYRKWCKDFGLRSSSPSIAKIADFLTYMFKSKGAALSTIKGYRAMLSAVFKFPLPEISTSPILKDLIRSFEISAPRPLFPPPPWDLDKVLQYLSGPPFESLARASFLDKTKKALFLLAMATAKRVSELQALSFSVSFQGEDLVLFYDPFFRAKTESVSNPLPRSIIVPSLSDFAGDLPERVHCPVRAIKFLRKAARSASFIPSRLFVSLRNLERAMSKNAMSFYLRQLIVDSGAVSSARPPRAHDIRGIATSLNYYSNLSLSNLMQVATWRSNRVFASRYLKEVSATQDNIQQFGPLVIAGDRHQPKPPKQKHRL